MKLAPLFLSLLLSSSVMCQSAEEQLYNLLSKKDLLKIELQQLNNKIIDIKHEVLIDDLKAIGLPSANYIEHSAMILEYSEEHEQAKWVAHMIVTDIIDGKEGRTNDFRIDPKITTGTTEQVDYFLTDTLENGDVEYDGYGYDRGHLAASADFRWSLKALSESYFYSNMSPQSEKFNRESWAHLEGILRAYVMAKDVPLYIITAPVLHDQLPKIARSKNQVSIPEQFVKVAYDPVHKLGIAFIMPNDKAKYPLEHYAVSIDEAEKALGLDLFPTLPESIESAIDKKNWFEGLGKGEAEPIYQPSMPRNHFNTVVGGDKLGQKVTVCGKVVASRYSRKGHLWMNLDKSYPNQLFSVFIKKDNLIHFDHEIKDYYLNKKICVTGQVESFDKKNIQPLIQPKNSKAIKFYQDPKSSTLSGR